MSGRPATGRVRTQTIRFSPEDTRKTPDRTIPPKTGNAPKSKTPAKTKTATKPKTTAKPKTAAKPKTKTKTATKPKTASKSKASNNGLTKNQRLLLGKKQLELGISPQKIPINNRRRIAREVGVPPPKNKNKKPEHTVKKNYRPKVTFEQLAKLRNEQTNKNKRTIVVAMISAQKNVPGAQQIIPKNLNKTQDLLKEKLKVLSERSIPVKETTHNFNEKDVVHDFLLMIWGDLKHDGLLTNDQYRFSSFLGGDIAKRLTDNKNVKFNKESELVQKLLKYGIINYTNKQQVDIRIAGNAEQKHKEHFADLWNSGKRIHIPKRDIGRSIARLRKPRAKTIHLCIDSESGLSSFSKLIDNSLYVAQGGTKQQKFVKRFVTLPNLLDPGRGQNVTRGGMSKPGGLIDILQTKLFNSNEIPSTRFNLQKFTFNFGGVIKIEMKEENSGFKYLLNGKEIKTSVKRANAGNSNIPGDKISKLFGDLMQILVVSAIEKEVNRNICGATFDGAFVGMSGYVQRHLFGQSPKLFIENVSKLGAKNAKSGLIIYGFDGILNTPMTNNTQSGNNTERSATPGSKVTLPPRPAKQRPSAPKKRVTWENNTAREKLEMQIRKRKLNNVYVNGYLKQYDNGKITANQIIEKVDAAVAKNRKLATYERRDTLRRRTS
tara:strand:- start:45 stop:2027 length:1983 start_codon:yes stop_codon:yes gene_type:complete